MISSQGAKILHVMQYGQKKKKKKKKRKQKETVLILLFFTFWAEQIRIMT